MVCAFLELALIICFFIDSAYGPYRRDYCEIKCGDSIHTMCETYYKPGGGEHCEKFKVSFRPVEVYNMVNNLNEWRNTLALGKLYNLPPASNMVQVNWDEEAFSIAKRWAEQCDQVIEDRCRKLLLTSRDDGGQCLAGTLGRGRPRMDVIGEMLDYWFHLAKNMTNLPKSIDLYRPTTDEMKYFTQLAWAQTDRIGCGLSVTDVTTVEGKEDKKYKLVCNLYRKGNIKNRAMYLRGPPCTACPPDHPVCSVQYTALCTKRTEAPSCSRRLKSLLKAPVYLLLVFILIN